MSKDEYLITDALTPSLSVNLLVPLHWQLSVPVQR